MPINPTPLRLVDGAEGSKPSSDLTVHDAFGRVIEWLDQEITGKLLNKSEKRALFVLVREHSMQRIKSLDAQ